MRIDENFPFENLILVKALKQRDQELFAKVKELFHLVGDLLNARIPSIFPNFTLHNTGHSFRMMECMSCVISDIEKLNPLEIALLIQSALLHDIGMAASQDEIQSIKEDRNELTNIKWSAMLKVQPDEGLAIQEIIRRIHAKLSGKYVKLIADDFFALPSLSSITYGDILALICESHTESYDWIRTNLKTAEVKGEFRVNPQYIAAILRLSDILDIDSCRTPYALQKAINPTGLSKDEWDQHFVISNTNKIEINPSTKMKQIAFHGNCKSPAVHRKILGYIDWVEDEITNAFQLLNSMSPQYIINFETKPTIAIQTIGYVFSDKKMKLNFKAITSLLMGEKIYGSKSLGLRELIQNAIDSCCLRREIAESTKVFGEDEYLPKVKIILNKDANSVVITDNGLGMTLDVINNHFLNVGSSYYGSQDFLLSDYKYKPIGNFGIGFLACFMLSNFVQITTRHFQGKSKYVIELERGVEFTSVNTVDDVGFLGTEIRLNYKEFMSCFNNKVSEVESFIQLYFITDQASIEIIDQCAQMKVTVKNSLVPQIKKNGNSFVIDFGSLLNGISGYAEIKKHRPYIRNILDIDFPGDVYFYDGANGLVPYDECDKYKFSDFFYDDTFRYIDIPLVTALVAKAFDVGMEYTNGDLDEVINRNSDHLEWISILIPITTEEVLLEEELSQGRQILEYLAFDDLVQLGHSKYQLTKVYNRSVNLFESIKDELYLPFDAEADASRYWRHKYDNKMLLYVRNVLIKDFSFIITNSASIFELEKIVVNIESRRVIPEISRNNLNVSDSKLINHAISKAIHIGASKSLDLNEFERAAIQQFAKEYYKQISEFDIT